MIDPRYELPKRELVALCLHTLVACAFVFPAFAQGETESEEAAASPSETFTESIDVRVVNLEIVVTDRDGERVLDLKPEDFILEVEGDEMPIDYFSEIRDGKAIAKSADSDTRAAPSVTEGDTVPTRYLLFIDGAFGIPEAYQRFENTVSEQVGELGPGEEMAIVFYNGSEIQELSDWTSSPIDLQDALAEIDLDTFDGWKGVQDWKGYQASISDELSYVAGTAVRGDPATPWAELPEFAVTKKRLERSVDRVSRAVLASLYRFSETDGRKVAILWSGGWTWSSLKALHTPWSRDLSTGSRTETYLRKITDTANRLGYTLYMADTPHSYYTGLAADEQHTTLDFLAYGTGGKAFKDRYGLQALKQSRLDTRSYYWLGFTAQSGGSGERFKIKLKTKRRGLDVRTRKSWLDLPRQTEINQQVEAMAFFNNEEMGAANVAIELEFGEPEIKGRRATVPVIVGIPLKGITMLPSAEEFHAQLEVRVSVVDEDGGINEMPVTPLQFSGPEPQIGDIFYYETQLKMRRKQHEVTIAVHDTASGEILVGHHSLSF